MVTFENFYKNTEAVFKGCKIPKREPSYISYGRYGVSSRYWYGEDSRGKYVIRESDHWTKVKQKFDNHVDYDCERIGTCQWHLNTTKDYSGNDETFSGKCYLVNFNFM